MKAIFIQFLNKFGQGYKLQIVFLLFAAVIAGIMEMSGMILIFPLIAVVNDESIIHTNEYFKMVYDFLGLTSSKQMLYLLAVSIGLVFIIKNLYMILFHHGQLKLLKKWRDELANVIMCKYLKVPYTFHLGRSSSDLINTLNYTSYYVLNMFMLPAINFLSALIVIVILLGFIMYQFFWASVISGFLLLITSYLQSQLIKKETNRINKEANKTRAFNLSILTQAIGSIKETKAYNKENHFNERFIYSNGRVSEFDRRAVFWQLIPMYITEMALVITIIVMMILVLSEAYSPIHGLTSLAILAAVAFRIAPMINRALGSYSQMRISFETIKELMDEVEGLEKWDIEDYEDADIQPVKFQDNLTLKNVSFEYKANIAVLKDLSLTVRKGEFIGVVGASGAGKTTLVDVILGLLQPTGGSYLIDSVEMGDSNLIGLRKLMGYVSQSPYIFNSTIRENVAYGVDPSDIDDAKVLETLKLAQLQKYVEDAEEGIYTNIGDAGKTMSGGQRQRLAIARALYNDPEIIVLDEATASLDVETEHEITQVINKLKGDKTVIAIAHRLSTLKGCDRILFMEDGEIKDTGTFKELSAKHPNFARILELSTLQPTQDNAA